MKIKKIETDANTEKCQECGVNAQIILETEEGTNKVYLCMNCFLNIHDRDRINWYRRIWTLKSMLEEEERAKKPSPKWGIRYD